MSSAHSRLHVAPVCVCVCLCVICNMLALRNSFLHVRMLVSFLRMNCKSLLEQEGMLVSRLEQDSDLV
jgi:hypothetical protein